MRKLFSFAMITLMLGLVSCTKDNTIEEEDTSSSGAASLSFTFNKPKSAYTQTRADIATADEWYIDAIDVYAAVDGTVEKLASTDYTQVDGTKEYTITVNTDWIAPNTGKLVNFYFVGNDATSIEGTHDALAETAESDFKNALTDEIQLTPDKANLIEANGSTKNLLFSAVAENVRLMGKVQVSGTLKRREARFDIVNPIKDTFIINKIYVTNASRQGLIFTNANTAATMTKADHVDITGPVPGDYVVENSETIAKSVFYLYPTTLGGTETNIVVEATANGYTSRYAIVSSTKILANTRYKIVIDPATLTLSLVVADYEEDVTLAVEELSTPGLISLTTTNATGVLTNSSYQMVTNGTGSIKATLGALSSTGFNVSVSGATIPGLDAATIAASMTVGAITTRASLYYPVTFDIEPNYTDAIANAGTEVLVTFTDKVDSKNTASVLFYDPASSRIPQADANSYIVKPGSSAIEISMDRVYAHWGAKLADDVAFNSKFLWTDIPAGMSPTGAIANVYVKGVGNSATLYVNPGSAEGNAVIAVTVNDEIKWSWHFWVTNYDPETTNDVYKNTGGQSKNYPDANRTLTFMNRNLGAMSATPGDPMTHGMMYQWGRKDPFIGKNNWVANSAETPIYSADGVAFEVSKIKVQDTPTKGNPNNLDYTITNPGVFILNATDYENIHKDWYTTIDDRSAQNDKLWATLDGSFNAIKTIYDPCPNGWRLPASGAWANLTATAGNFAFPWSPSTYGRFGIAASPQPTDGIDAVTTNTATAAGISATLSYYPASSARTTTTGEFSIDGLVGEWGYCWTSTGEYGNDSGYAIAFRFNNESIARSVGHNRAPGFPVRCVKE